MANAASPNVSLPPTEEYRKNWDAIFKKKKAPTKKKPAKKITTRSLGRLGFAMYGIK
jgi:hypothetical protein